MNSKYSQRMIRLSTKIFGEYRRPQMPPEIGKERLSDNKARQAWDAFHHRNENTVLRHSVLPLDLDRQRNPNYYPPHPQHIKLIKTLREYGLFRDEHLDFIEEMTRLKELRGKFTRRREGKRAQLKAQNQ